MEMKFIFFKYQGTGNDFIIIDNRKKTVNLNSKQIALICHRKFGIGADGLMLLENHQEFDFNMRYFNSDGKEASMCGNGGRCLVAFAKSMHMIENKTRFNTFDGVHEAIIKDNNIITLRMQDVSAIKKTDDFYFLDTGSPQYVKFSKNVKEIDVYSEGQKIRFSKNFSPDGTNVNFVEMINDKLFVRTYERGVENETLSCGTGVTASAICASIELNTDKNSFDIITPGGNLNVSYKKQPNNLFTDIWLTGPAKFVFKGEYEI